MTHSESLDQAGATSEIGGVGAVDFRRRAMICLDIDGTTVHHDGHLSENVYDAVQEVRAAGHVVVLATGRSVIATTPIADLLGIHEGYAVCSNGAVTVRLDPSRAGGYEIVETVAFDPAPALTVVREKFPNAVIAVEEMGVGFRMNGRFPDGELQGELREVSWDDLIRDPVTRVCVRDTTATSAEFEHLVEHIGLHGVNYAVGYTAWLDLTPEGVSKASALEQVRRALQIEPGDTVAVGDQRNDLEMLRWAARGVAMGQAPDEVKAAADEVTAPVEDDGLALVLRSVPLF
ncbi:HAD family hydrolase [Kribbia dieselivorans]|uniref:HAD family hydrolase n=1 Tax=Kribbia dieselivorans TaxID=331526 RepID=UPI0009FAD2FB